MASKQAWYSPCGDALGYPFVGHSSTTRCAASERAAVVDWPRHIERATSTWPESWMCVILIVAKPTAPLTPMNSVVEV
jgi:hypothetical protein